MMMASTPDILATIKAHKLSEVAAAKSRASLAELRARAADQAPARGFARALRGGRAEEAPRTPGRRPRLVAEIKKASPSKGVIRADFDPVAIARSYEAGGADAISCLTDARFFQGSLDYLAQARRAVALPVLRKEFIIDPWQIWEARAAGADAILLIAGMVEPELQAELRAVAREAGLDVLLEIHSEDELEEALALAPDVLGINNRDLRAPGLPTDLSATRRLAPRVPTETTLISESGIRDADDVAALAALGVDGLLAGECLMREADPGRAIAERLGLGPAWPTGAS
jgi:indole-3-glycerol phosphate synthase